MTVNEIMEANEMRPRDVRRLRAGQTIRVPGAFELIPGARQDYRMTLPVQSTR